ncbi:divalent cation tolerance protein CutA [Nocardia sp. XZ_19_385]|uniref:divalent-cation tolerance protein CutA n=1 Tax=Nocardia sp. XZ_19_385 TaxID=2769488 RepID=UPI002815D4C9|nr:divalent cation tolerance protein CutA [Nocardia sp. XZ_19_385]
MAVWTVTTTTPTEQSAEEIAETVVGEQLAAAAWISGPVKSVWWHLGEPGSGQEWRVELRTLAGIVDRLMVRIRVLHPWDNPELVGIPVGACSPEYAK